MTFFFLFSINIFFFLFCCCFAHALLCSTYLADICFWIFFLFVKEKKRKKTYPLLLYMLFNTYESIHIYSFFFSWRMQFSFLIYILSKLYSFYPPPFNDIVSLSLFLSQFFITSSVMKLKDFNLNFCQPY